MKASRRARSGLIVISTFAMFTAVAGAQARSRFSDHPAATELDVIFSSNNSVEIQNTPITKSDYLKLAAGIVDFFKQHQNDKGAIIDPVVKHEVQYATPAFAFTAAELVANAHRDDLLPPAIAAMNCATTALAEHHAAENHADFYIPLLMHAHRLLASRAPADVVKKWDDQFRSIVPQKTYRMDLRQMNWNMVSSSGELFRRELNLVADDQKDLQQQYLEECLTSQQKHFTKFGMYLDPGGPLAYDEFTRLWLQDVMANKAYDGPSADVIKTFLHTGGFSTLLLLSPSGEWASGGRSAFHQWNEAETAAIAEMNANQWKDDPAIAGAFKRAAHLALQSMQRWQRPSGELWIIKNRYEPKDRFAYEAYSQHSQYNILAGAMLSLAYEQADDTIAERAIPSEGSAYVFDVRDTFHKIAAAAGGYYVLIDTAGEPHYNGTGLQRVHRIGVPFSPLSDSTSAERVYGAKTGDKIAMTPGLIWKENADEKDWRSLAAPGKGGEVKSADLQRLDAPRGQTKFQITYTLGNDRKVIETYSLSSQGVDFTSSMTGGSDPAAAGVLIPALTFDGAEKTSIELLTGSAKVTWRGATLSSTVQTRGVGAFELIGPEVIAHNGTMRAAIAPLPAGTREITLHFSLK